MSALALLLVVAFLVALAVLGTRRGRRGPRRRSTRRALPRTDPAYLAFVARHCGTKVRHGDRSAARRHAVELTAKDGARMDTYRCEVCGAWHVGHGRD